jgi:hypothetical protein
MTRWHSLTAPIKLVGPSGGEPLLLPSGTVVEIDRGDLDRPEHGADRQRGRKCEWECECEFAPLATGTSA